MNQFSPERSQTFMLDLIVTILAPLFLGVTGGDTAAAYMAATAMVNEYRARNQCDVLAVAQIIVLGLASIHAFTRSMEDDISIPDMLALQRSGNALTRSGETLKRRSEKTPDDTQPYVGQTPVTAAEAPPTGDIANPPITAQGVSEDRMQEMWAIAMVSEASEINASLDNLPPKERRAAEIRAGVLSSMANELLTGVPPLPLTPRPPSPDAIPPPL